MKCWYSALFVLSILCYFIGGANGQDNRTCEERVNCFDCILGIGCGWCYGGRGNDGCTNGTMNGPTNTSACLLGDPYGQSWAGTPNDCPDNCDVHDNYDCNHCIIHDQCVWCQDGAGCRTGTAGGPWGPIPACNDSRFYTDDNDGPIYVKCASFRPCSEQPTCATCLANFEGKGKTCTWCNGPKTTSPQCISANTTQSCTTLGSNYTSWDQAIQCPVQMSSVVSVFSCCSVALTVAFLMSLLF